MGLEFFEGSEDADDLGSHVIERSNGHGKVTVADRYFERKLALHVHATLSPDLVGRCETSDWCLVFEKVGFRDDFAAAGIPVVRTRCGCAAWCVAFGRSADSAADRARDSVPARRRDDWVAAVVQDAGWFADRDPRSRAQVRVTLNGGQNPSLLAAAPEMLQWMQGIKQDVFSCESCSVMDAEDVFLEPTISDGLWPGPARHRATFHGTLAEWSLDGVGWLAGFLAVASSRHGVNTPLTLTASRATS